MLVKQSNMQAYFREALDAAVRESNICVTQAARIYVVNLLQEFSRSEIAFAGTDHGEKLIMVEMLERALKASGLESLQIFRHMGDSALYILGFFKEAGQHRIVSNSYYQDIGSHAYLCAANLSRSHQVQGVALYLELSERFADMVKMIEIISKYGTIDTAN